MPKIVVALLVVSTVFGQGPFVWPDQKRVAVSLSFDDARASQVTNGLALFARYGVHVTFFVNPRNMITQLDGWKKIVAQGHEIGNHSDTHPCSGICALFSDPS